MKYYATTESERATKGQGGNKLLKITLQRDPKQRKVTHVIEYGENGLTVSAVTDDGGIIVYQEKGEKKKGETEHTKDHKWCGACHDGK